MESLKRYIEEVHDEMREASNSGGIRKFRRQLSAYDDPSLRRIFEYYKDDLTYILENMNPHAVLVELKSRNVLNTDKYLAMEEDPSSFSQTLLQDIQDRGREAVIGLWECLYALQKYHPHPNLLAALDEITKRGKDLKDQILLDELAHSLTPELRECVYNDAPDDSQLMIGSDGDQTLAEIPGDDLMFQPRNPSASDHSRKGDHTPQRRDLPTKLLGTRCVEHPEYPAVNPHARPGWPHH